MSMGFGVDGTKVGGIVRSIHVIKGLKALVGGLGWGGICHGLHDPKLGGDGSS